MATSVLTFLLAGNDVGASRAIAKVGAAASATSKEIDKAGNASAAAAARVGKAFDAVGKLSTAITVGIGIAGVKAAVSFEQALTRVSTQAGVSQNKLKPLGDALLKLSPKVGFNPNDLAVSLYHVESAFQSTGISAGKAIDIVAQASKLAKIGNANLEDTTQAIIGTLASGIKGVKDATDAAAQLNQLVGSGDTTLSAVDKAIASGILPTSAALGLSFKDVAAALATLTDNATPADEAATRLRTTFSLIEKPSKQAVGALESIGLNTTSLAEDFRKPDGLLVALSDLKTHLDATYPPSKSTKLTLDEINASTKGYVTSLEAQGVQQKTAIDLGKKYAASLQQGGTAATQQAQTILTAFGGAKSGSTFLTLYEELTRLQSKYHDFGSSAQAAAKFQNAWAQQQTTAKQRLDDLKASWDVFLVKVGNAILPDLKKIVDVLSKHPGIIKAAAVAVAGLAAAWTISKFATAFSVIAKLTQAILGIGAASTTAAAESAAANVGGAAAGAAGAAEGAAAGGALSRLGRTFPALRIAVPVIVTAASIKILGLQKQFEDELHGNLAKAIQDAPKWELGLTAGVGRVAHFFGDKNAYTGNITGQATGKLAIAHGYAEQIQFVKADKAVIADFSKTLAIANNLLDTNNATLVGNTAAAVTNRAAIGLLVQKAKDGAEAQFRLTGKQSDYNAAIRLAIPAIENAAVALGFNKQQVDNLIHSLGLIPPTKTTTVTVDDGTAVINLRAIKDALDRIPAQKFVDVQVLTTGTASAASIAQATSGFGHGLGGGGVATGGLLRGPGTGTSDSLVARVSNGEYVVRAASVQKYGVGFMNAVNAGRYARGGYVGAVPSGGGDVHVHVHAWDGPSVDKWLRQGGAKKIAIEVKRATKDGMNLN